MPDLRRKLPSSHALFVFDAAARNGSFTAAAAELNVTQPAVSRMLGQFEDYLGVRLFDRSNGRAALTEEGEILYRHVSDGFRSIEGRDYRLGHDAEAKPKRLPGTGRSRSSAPDLCAA